MIIRNIILIFLKMFEFNFILIWRISKETYIAFHVLLSFIAFNYVFIVSINLVTSFSLVLFYLSFLLLSTLSWKYADLQVTFCVKNFLIETYLTCYLHYLYKKGSPSVFIELKILRKYFLLTKPYIYKNFILQYWSNLSWGTWEEIWSS